MMRMCKAGILLVLLMVVSEVGLAQNKTCTCFKEYATQATMGDAESQFRYSQCLLSFEKECDTTPAAGMQWVMKAARQGHVKSQYVVGMNFLIGYGAPADSKRGIEWLEKAAEAGFGPAWIDLGQAYERGVGVEKNLDKARSCYTRAAMAGEPQGTELVKKLEASRNPATSKSKVKQ